MYMCVLHVHISKTFPTALEHICFVWIWHFGSRGSPLAVFLSPPSHADMDDRWSNAMQLYSAQATGDRVKLTAYIIRKCRGHGGNCILPATCMQAKIKTPICKITASHSPRDLTCTMPVWARYPARRNQALGKK